MNTVTVPMPKPIITDDEVLGAASPKPVPEAGALRLRVPRTSPSRSPAVGPEPVENEFAELADRVRTYLALRN